MRCLNCKKNTKNPKFCNHSCSASYNNRIYKKKILEPRHCLFCGCLLIRQKKFCNSKCQAENTKKNKLQEFISTRESNGKFKKGIRKHILDKAGNQCQKCGWNKVNKYGNVIFLEIHHKDGNRKNNKEKNIEVLCPNCHSLTKNYRFLNKK